VSRAGPGSVVGVMASRVHLLERVQRVDLPAGEAFAFFADALNLERITPPWLGFGVLAPGPIAMRPGALIDYRLRLHGVPLRWRTQIAVWEPPVRFVDVQVRGPYARWEHTHEFEPDGDEAVVIRDRVRYALPLGLLGRIAHAAFVRRDLERIFDHRRRAVAAQLGRPAT
jgi:ligand-binding SRPBCC domain-containing protein